MSTNGGEQKTDHSKTRRELPSEANGRGMTPNRLPASHRLVREPEDEAGDLDVPCTD